MPGFLADVDFPRTIFNFSIRLLDYGKNYFFFFTKNIQSFNIKNKPSSRLRPPYSPAMRKVKDDVFVEVIDPDLTTPPISRIHREKLWQKPGAGIERDGFQATIFTSKTIGWVLAAWISGWAKANRTNPNSITFGTYFSTIIVAPSN